jgi:hypothetical protein
MSSTEITDNTLSNLFDDLTGVENAASESEYRCVFVHNNHGSLSMLNTRIAMVSTVAGGANQAIALAQQGVVSATSATAQADRVADENTAPSGEVFSTIALDYSTGLVVGTIPAGSCIGVWVRRDATNSAPVDSDGFTLRVYYDTMA